MKTKTLLLLVIIAGALAGAAYFLTQTDQISDQGVKMGDTLLPELSVNDVRLLAITDGENAVTLQKTEESGVWVIKDRYDYPANFSRIADLVKQIGDLKIGNSFPADKDTNARLALLSPETPDTPEEQKGSRLTLKDGKGQVMADLIVGNARQSDTGRGGQYVRPETVSEIFLVDQNIRFMDTDPAKWLDKLLFEITQDKIKEVSFTSSKPDMTGYTATRPESGQDPVLADIPEGKITDTAAVKSLLGAMTAFQMDDVVDPAETVMNEAEASTYTFTLFDGTIYTIRIGDKAPGETERYYAEIDVDWAAPPEPPAETAMEPETPESEEPAVTEGEKPESEDQAKQKAEEQEKEKKKKQDEMDAAKQKAKELEDKLSKWTFLIPKWKYDKFVADKEKLIKDEEKKPAPAPMTEALEMPDAAAPSLIPEGTGLDMEIPAMETGGEGVLKTNEDVAPKLIPDETVPESEPVAPDVSVPEATEPEPKPESTEPAPDAAEPAPEEAAKAETGEPAQAGQPAPPEIIDTAPTQEDMEMDSESGETTGALPEDKQPAHLAAYYVAQNDMQEDAGSLGYIEDNENPAGSVAAEPVRGDDAMYDGDKQEAEYGDDSYENGEEYEDSYEEEAYEDDYYDDEAEYTDEEYPEDTQDWENEDDAYDDDAEPEETW